jgi:hypothetical protein
MSRVTLSMCWQDLGALEEMAAVQAGAEDEVAGQQGLGIAEDLEDFFLGRTHAPWIRRKTRAGRGDIRPDPQKVRPAPALG